MITIKCNLFKNFSVNELKIAKIGLGYLNEALNDVAFHQSVSNAKFYGTDDSSAAILDKLLSGADSLDPTIDNVLNVQFVMYYNWFSRAIGYVLDNDRTIYCNRKYYGNPVNFASNCLHEYMHLIGYSHKSARDFGSVPYRMNSLFEGWCIKKGYN
jgi:hypothetical protein